MDIYGDFVITITKMIAGVEQTVFVVEQMDKIRPGTFAAAYELWEAGPSRLVSSRSNPSKSPSIPHFCATLIAISPLRSLCGSILYQVFEKCERLSAD